MTDPEKLIKSLPEESPPPEIVLAAVRVFRYRAITTVLLAVVVAAVGVWLSSRLLAPKVLDAEVASARQNGFTGPVAEEQVIDGVHVVFWEIVVDGRMAWAHVEAWDPEQREIDLQATKLQLAGSPVSPLEAGGGFSCCQPSAGELWVSFEDPVSPGRTQPLSVDVQVLVAGEPSEAPLGTAHFEVDLVGGGP